MALAAAASTALLNRSFRKDRNTPTFPALKLNPAAMAWPPPLIKIPA